MDVAAVSESGGDGDEEIVVACVECEKVAFAIDFGGELEFALIVAAIAVVKGIVGLFSGVHLMALTSMAGDVGLVRLVWLRVGVVVCESSVKRLRRTRRVLVAMYSDEDGCKRAIDAVDGGNGNSTRFGVCVSPSSSRRFGYGNRPGAEFGVEHGNEWDIGVVWLAPSAVTDEEAMGVRGDESMVLVGD